MKVETKVRGRKLIVSSKDVKQVARKLSPENIRKHYVVVNKSKFPPKQLYEGLLKIKGIKIDRLFFTTKDASYLFHRLGFSSGRINNQKRGILALEKIKGAIAIGGNAVVDSEKYYE